MLAGQRAAGTWGEYGRLARPALPMLALVAGATWLVQAQSPMWQLAISGRYTPTIITLLDRLWRADPEDLYLGALLPIPIIVVFAVALAVLHVWYLDRLAIRAGSDGP